MSLKIVRITRDFPDMNALEQIAVEAFPPQEYVSPQDLLSYTESSDDWAFMQEKILSVIFTLSDIKIWYMSAFLP